MRLSHGPRSEGSLQNSPVVRGLYFDTFRRRCDRLLVQVQGATAERRDTDVHILRGIAESAATELLHIQAQQEPGPAQAIQAQQSNASLLQNPAPRASTPPRSGARPIATHSWTPRWTVNSIRHGPCGQEVVINVDREPMNLHEL